MKFTLTINADISSEEAIALMQEIEKQDAERDKRWAEKMKPVVSPLSKVDNMNLGKNPDKK